MPFESLLLLLLVGLPVAFSGVIALRPAAAARGWALGGSLVFLALAAALLGRFFESAEEIGPAGFGAESSFAWLPGLGVTLSFGIDGVAALLIGLTALLGPVCVLASWTAIASRQRLFYGWLIALQAAMYGVFAARDLVVFYVCFEFTLLPMFVLIREFGSTNRHRAAVKFFLYTFTGSLIALAGLVYAAAAVSSRAGAGVVPEGFSLSLETVVGLAPTVLTPGEQAWVLLALLAGFAVKVPLFPVHTWLPLAHTEAPTAGSVILAGVLLKLGTYAIYRIVLPMVPAAAHEYAPLIGVLSVVGVVYAGLICWVQTDIKKLVAYSSVSHLGFCVLGLFALNQTGMAGSVLYMINHGLSTGALFLLIGFAYERYHTRSLKELGGLGSKMPVWSTMMVFFAMASVGLPGLNGFPSELLCMMGAFQSYTPWAGEGLGAGAGEAAAGGLYVGATWGRLGPWFALAAALGVIIAAIYLLTMVAGVVWGTLKEPEGHGHVHGDGDEPHAKLPADLTFREIVTLAPIAALCLLFGLQPNLLLGPIEGGVNAQAAAIRAGYELTPITEPPLDPRELAGADALAADAPRPEPQPGPTPGSRPAAEGGLLP